MLLAIAVGVSIFCCAETIAKPFTCIFIGTMATCLAWMLWCFVPYSFRAISSRPNLMKYTTPLEVRLRHVLTEARVLLPGAQALLGFQLITFYMDDFAKLPHFLKLIHLASLLLIAFAAVLLIAPAAFHRIADLGEATERSYCFCQPHGFMCVCSSWSRTNWRPIPDPFQGHQLRHRVWSERAHPPSHRHTLVWLFPVHAKS